MALNATDPPPLPLAPLVTVSHDASLLTLVHAHPVGAVTVVEPVPPLTATDWLAGLIAYVQDAAACVTVNRRPAIIKLPVRWVVLVLGAMVKLTEPAPEPVAPLVMVIQEAPLPAVQLQPVVVVTAADPVPPAAVTVWLVGEIESEHADAFCVTVNVWLPIVMVPVRNCVAALAVTLNVTRPLPLPPPPGNGQPARVTDGRPGAPGGRRDIGQP